MKRRLFKPRRYCSARSSGCNPPRSCPCPRAPAPTGHRGRLGPSRRQGAEPANTAPSLARAQNHALLYGPFPRGGLARGVSDGELMLSENAAVRAQTMSRVRALGGSVARIPVDWRNVVEAKPAGGLSGARSGQSRLPLRPARRGRAQRRGRRAATAAGRLPRAGLRRSSPPLALRLSRQLGAQPAGARRIRGGLGPAATTAPSPTRCIPARHCRACGCSRRGTSPTSRATWSPNGWRSVDTGAPSRRGSTASC